jgi:uncharacterized heparinase superfamily protein
MAGRPKSHLSFWLEVAAALWRRAMAPLRILWRRSWFYRLLLRGRMPARIAFHPTDFSPRRLEQADALLRGRFRFAGETVELRDGTIFDAAPPSLAWAEALHGFDWLPPLASAGGEPARVLATNLIGQWLRQYARYSEPAWRADVLARRLTNLFAHTRFVFPKADVMWRSKVLVSLREQSRMLARISREAPDGVPRLEAAAAHALSGICLDDSAQRLASGLARLQQECERQILSDGGHMSRSPRALLEAYRQLAMLNQSLVATGHSFPPELQEVQERMGAMLRFFRLGDGTLALFNGGGEGNAKLLAHLLARDQVRAQPSGSAPASGYQRLVSARSILVVDCGRFPPGAVARSAHAGCLAFEFSTAHQRIVVNCGAAPEDPRWSAALRQTAAHSTVTLGEQSVGAVLGGRLARLLGPRLTGGPTAVPTHRQESSEGWTVEASHDGYLAAFGIVHERRLTLSSNGRMLSGSDRLLSRGGRRPRQAVPFAARFHIHPDVRASGSYGRDILLKLPSGDGWRFQATGGETSVARSVYLGGDALRRCDQLVVSGSLGNEPVELAWSFERIG